MFMKRDALLFNSAGKAMFNSAGKAMFNSAGKAKSHWFHLLKIELPAGCGQLFPARRQSTDAARCQGAYP